MTLGVEDAGIGWGDDGGMSPARTTRTREEEEHEEEDLYGEQMLVDEEEEVPPTQQERYQGIFDFWNTNDYFKSALATWVFAFCISWDVKFHVTNIPVNLFT